MMILSVLLKFCVWRKPVLFCLYLVAKEFELFHSQFIDDFPNIWVIFGYTSNPFLFTGISH